MILDAETRLASAQALTASGATTDYYDCGADTDIGRGEPMAMVFHVTTAADFTTTDETYAFAVQTDDNTSFSSAATLTSRTVAAANLAAGDRVVLPFTPDNERYIRGYLTLGGTTPSISVDCDILPLSMVGQDHDIHYASGFDIT